MNKNSEPFHPTDGRQDSSVENTEHQDKQAKRARSILKNQERPKKHHSEHKQIKSVHYALYKQTIQSQPLDSNDAHSSRPTQTDYLFLLQKSMRSYDKSKKNPGSVSKTKIDSSIELHLTPDEKKDLARYNEELDKLVLPVPPLDSIGLYQEHIQGTLSEYNMSDQEILDLWRSESEEKKTRFEELAGQKQAEYRSEYDRVSQASEALWSKIHLIEAKGNMQKRIKEKSKKISPYRVYKRETASNVKSEFPNMSNEERSQIVKERWRFISQQDKAIFVALARLEEEQTVHQATMDFYGERISTAKTLGGTVTADSLGSIFDLSFVETKCKALVAKDKKEEQSDDQQANKNSSISQTTVEQSNRQQISSSSSEDNPIEIDRARKTSGTSNNGSTGSNTGEAATSSDEHAHQDGNMAELSCSDTNPSPDYLSPEVNYSQPKASTLQVFDYIPPDNQNTRKQDQVSKE